MPNYPDVNTRYGYARTLLRIGNERAITPAGTLNPCYFRINGGADYWRGTDVRPGREPVPAANGRPEKCRMPESHHPAGTRTRRLDASHDDRASRLFATRNYSELKFDIEIR